MKRKQRKITYGIAWNGVSSLNQVPYQLDWICMDKATAKYVKRFEYTVYSLISRNKGNIKWGSCGGLRKKVIWTWKEEHEEIL